MEILLTLLKNPTARLIIVVLLLILTIGGVFAILTRRAREAERELQREKLERERIERRNEGLEILSNAGNTARDVERLKEKANAQAVNSNTAVNSARDSVNRDSRTFSNNDADVWRRFCAAFPSDSRCR